MDSLEPCRVCGNKDVYIRKITDRGLTGATVREERVCGNADCRTNSARRLLTDGV